MPILARFWIVVVKIMTMTMVMMVMMMVMMMMMMMVMAYQEVLTCCRSCTSSAARDNFGTRPTQNIVIMIMILIVIMIVMLIMIMMLPLIYLGHPFAKARYLSDSVNKGIFEFFFEMLLFNFFNNKKSGFI